MDQRLSLARHRYIIHKFTTVGPAKRKTMLRSAPPIFFKILKQAARVAILRKIEIPTAQKILTSKSIKRYAASKQVVTLLKRIL